MRRFGGMLVYPRYLTLEFRFMRFLRAVVLEACKELRARAEGRSEGQVQLILPDDEKHARSIERFYVEILPVAPIRLQHRTRGRSTELTGTPEGSSRLHRAGPSRWHDSTPRA